jgi:hypothetical protein
MEQVGEVSIVANAFNAEYGGFGNWFANVTIKSGTNEVHGSVFDHLGNDKLNARSFFQPKRTPYRQNEGGFTLWAGRHPTSTTAETDLRKSGAFLLATAQVETSSPYRTKQMLRGDFAISRRKRKSNTDFYPATTVPDGMASCAPRFPGTSFRRKGFRS